MIEIHENTYVCPIKNSKFKISRAYRNHYQMSVFGEVIFCIDKYWIAKNKNSHKYDVYICLDPSNDKWKNIPDFTVTFDLLQMKDLSEKKILEKIEMIKIFI